MTLTKNDLQQIGTVVEKKIDASEKRLDKKIEDEVGELAAMTKRGFDAQDEHFARQDKKLNRISMSVANLEFIATEMVRRDEFLEVKNRLTQIETKLGLVK